MQCTAKSKRSGERCKNHAMKGKTVCHIHGGKSKSGIEHPNYKTGRYVKGLADKKAKVIDNLLRDEDLLKLDDNIALMDLRIIELVDSLMEGGNPAELWKKALKSWELMWMATAREDSDAVAKHRNNLDEILRQGVREITTWDEIADRTETRRKLADTEMKRREKMQYLVMVEDTLKDYMALGRMIRRAIIGADISEEAQQSILGMIQDGFSRHMQIGTPQGAGDNASTIE